MKKLTLFALFVALMATLVGANSGYAQTPTVNGLFYGDGDTLNYSFLAADPGRGTLYYSLVGETLFVAMVLDSAVNDNVFSETKPYTATAGWSPKHQASKLIGSDHFQFKLTIGDSSWTWAQDLVYDNDPGAGYEWLSDPYGPDGIVANGGSPPAILDTCASSTQWNFKFSTWDFMGGNTDPNTWKSVDANSNNDVTDELGWGSTWHDTLHHWEWTITYEMRFLVSGFLGLPFSMQVITAHNSPSKDSDENTTIDSVDVVDYGDAPDPTYPTLYANNGARHTIVIGNIHLGSRADGDTNAFTNANATGDDSLDYTDDEDGVVFNTTLIQELF